MEKKEIVEAANRNDLLMDGTTAPVAKILGDNDVVFAVWQDESADDGVTTLILKGQRRLAAIAAEAKDAPAGTRQLKRGPQPLRWSAVKVLDFEMALAARQTLGEPE